SPEPFRQAYWVLRWLRQLMNRAKWRKYQVFTDNYAILNDKASSFIFLNYYIDQTSQRRQLEESNFTVMAVYDITGSELAPADLDTKSPWLTYVVKKSSDPNHKFPQDSVEGLLIPNTRAD